MHTWRSHLRATLFRLARTHGNNSIADIERTLCEVLDASSVRFVDLDDQPLDPNMQLRELLQKSFRTAIVVEQQSQQGRHQQNQGDYPNGESRFREDGAVAPEDRVEWFIREFDRLEQTHEFMWAGYIVKEMLPRIGVATAAARQMLDELQELGIVQVNKIPNPKNPEHPASAVHLVRENDRVKEVLNGQRTLQIRDDDDDVACDD